MSGADGTKPRDTISIDSQVELPADSGQFDLTAYAVALAFNNAALPPGMPEAMKAVIEARARDIRVAIEQGSTASEFTEAGALEKRRKDAEDRTDVRAAIIMAQQQREREEWMRGLVTVAGTTMTGTEWQNLSKRLREDEEFRERLTRIYMRRGMDRAEAEARVERVAEIGEISATAGYPPSRRHSFPPSANTDPVQAPRPESR